MRHDRKARHRSGKRLVLRRRLTYFEELRRAQRSERAILRWRHGVPAARSILSWIYKYLRERTQAAVETVALVLILVLAVPIWLVACPVLMWDLITRRLGRRSDSPRG